MDAADLCWRSAVEQKALLDRREVSALEMVDAHIERIERHNPVLNAFVTLRLEEAREEAKSADAAIANGDATGVLHGLPIGVKDCFQTKGLRTCPSQKLNLGADLADLVPSHGRGRADSMAG